MQTEVAIYERISPWWTLERLVGSVWQPAETTMFWYSESSVEAHATLVSRLNESSFRIIRHDSDDVSYVTEQIDPPEVYWTVQVETAVTGVWEDPYVTADGRTKYWSEYDARESAQERTRAVQRRTRVVMHTAETVVPEEPEVPTTGSLS